ncbi:MAG TPA: hypothetical protein VMF89_03280 [Polyangiales bacterium]|nr:hypothetical protein [Polyangiales bacterium]
MDRRSLWIGCVVALLCAATSAHAQDYEERCGAASGNICFTGGDLWMSAGTTLATAAVRLQMQSDGNLALYDNTGRALWGAGTYNYGGAQLGFTRDGNLAIYYNQRVLFSTGTAGRGSYLALQRDGNLVIYDAKNTPVWSIFPIR